MPVIVVGADTPGGRTIVDSLLEPGREVRVFVSDPEIGAELKAKGAKVAIGDVSDESHVEAAATRCFTAILVAEAARDDRERSFARNESQVLEGWANAVTGVQRVIWVHDGEPPRVKAPEIAVVRPGEKDLAGVVAELDDVAKL
jgi:uncharacterized protein YbjT (DUF2867 family)